MEAPLLLSSVGVSIRIAVMFVVVIILPLLAEGRPCGVFVANFPILSISLSFQLMLICFGWNVTSLQVEMDFGTG